MGDNSFITSSVTTDIAGNPRIYHSAIDIGAYEFSKYTTPVLLQYFTALQSKNKIHLSWTTASEFYNNNFIVSKSANGVDFQKLATIEGQGQSTQPTDYSWDDVHPLTGINFYQLQQTDVNGKITSLGVRSVLYNPPINSAVAFPNPAKGQVHIGLKNADIIKIYNVTGRRVLQF